MERRIVYLDSAATMLPTFWSKDFMGYSGNPNAKHKMGQMVRYKYEECKQRLKDILGVSSGEIFFARCATEIANELWLESFFGNRGRNFDIWCSPWEHDSCYVGSSEFSKDRNVFATDCYQIVFWQYVNHMTGNQFFMELPEKHDNTLLFSDFTAAIGKVEIPKIEGNFDAIWCSGHKFGAEGGGWLWVSDKALDWLPGIKYSFGGTPNVPQVVALTTATECAIMGTKENFKHYVFLWTAVQNQLFDEGIEHEIIGDNNLPITCAVMTLRFPGINADALATYLSYRKIYVSMGKSACSEDDDFRALESWGLTKEQAEECIRISFGPDSTTADTDDFVKAVAAFKEEYLN